MRKHKIKTTSSQGGYKAWLADDPKKCSTSTISAYSAAYNLAVKLFLGHNHLAQHDAAELRKVIVSQTGHGNSLATYDKEAVNAESRT